MSAAWDFVVRGGLAAAVLGLAAGSASADTIPRWDIYAICEKSSLGARCPTLESENRRTVFARWESLPASDRTACLAEVDHAETRSYQRLMLCIGDRAMKALDKDVGAPARPHDG